MKIRAERTPRVAAANEGGHMVQWRGFYIVLVLLLISGLAIGCDALSSVTNSQTSAPTLPDSEYPVDIIGSVTIAKTVIVGQAEHTLKGQEFWIVDTLIRNKAYHTQVTPTSWWTICLELIDPIGVIENFTPSSAPIPQGQSGKMILCFAVKAGLNPSDYRLCLVGYASYATQKEVRIPDSYGNLVNTNTIAEVYDWDSQKVVQAGKQTSPATNIAIVESMSVQLIPVPWANVGLSVQLKPINAKVGVIYMVSLYEKGNYRASNSITWNQPELNVGTIKQVGFPLTDDELKAYYSAEVTNNNWWKSIFSVKIHE